MNALYSERYNIAAKVHQDVSKFQYIRDGDQYGTPDYWDMISKAGKGDCEDYVLEFKWRLVELQVPATDLMIGVCVHPRGEEHGVLVMRDGPFDWILDQTQPVLMAPGDMKQLGYTGIMVQRSDTWMWRRWKI